MSKLLLISDPLQLWSGLYGSALSALLAAGVAILVVWLSNRAQAKQAAIGRDEAYTQAQKGLRDQRELLQLQLEEQKRANRASEGTAALSTFLALAQELIHPVNSRRLDDIVLIGVRMKSSAMTLHILGGEYNAAHDALSKAVHPMIALALIVLRDGYPSDMTSQGIVGTPWGSLGTLSTEIISCAQDICSEDEGRRVAAAASVEKYVNRAKADLAKYTSKPADVKG